MFQNMGGAVLVGGRAAVQIEAENGILERLEGFEEFENTGVERITAPHFLRRADERAGRDARPDEQGTSHLDRRGDAEVVTTVRGEIEFEITAHRRPVKKMGFVESGDFSSDKLRVLRELVQEPRTVG